MTTTCLLPTTASPGVAPLAQHQPGHRPPVLALARRCCPLLLRPLYQWRKAAVKPGIDLWQEALGQVPDQLLTINVPTWLPFQLKFVFKVVLNARTSTWRFAYTYWAQLHGLSKRETAAAQGLLTRLEMPGLVRPWWD